MSRLYAMTALYMALVTTLVSLAVADEHRVAGEPWGSARGAIPSAVVSGYRGGVISLLRYHPPLVALALLAVQGCASPIPASPRHLPAPAPAAAAVAPPAAATTEAPPPVPPVTTADACKAEEHRQFDFWIGHWNLVVSTRKAKDSDEWVESPATNHIQSILAGCAIEESFRAEGPGSPWAGRSVSVYVAATKQWRQTWVDDQGSYLAFTGGMESGRMVLHGEPRQSNGKLVQMRMVFSDITANHITWTWERTTDGGATWTPAMIILYTRAAT